MDYSKNKFGMGLGSLGMAAGLGYSIYAGTSFWKGLGITIVTGIAAGYAGRAIDILRAPEK
jgi:hypothetical protein